MKTYYGTHLKELIKINELFTVHYFEYSKNYIYHGESHDFWELVYADKKKNSGRYERDENLIGFPYVFSAEGYLRGESDTNAKFYFGEDKIGVLYYKNVRPLTEEFEKENIKVGCFGRCGNGCCPGAAVLLAGCCAKRNRSPEQAGLRLSGRNSP